MQEDDEDPAANFIADTIMGMALDGCCYELAVAIARGTGLPLVGLRGDFQGKITLRHAGVQLPDQTILDARGPVTLFAFMSAFYPDLTASVVPISEDDLRAVRPLDEAAVHLLARLSASQWPTLPWRTNFQMRATAFLAELEALSRKHNMWIYGPYPVAMPRISEDKSSSAGYRLLPTAEGLGLMIERHFDNPVTTPDDDDVLPAP
jgi:hypothetical protein